MVEGSGAENNAYAIVEVHSDRSITVSAYREAFRWLEVAHDVADVQWHSTQKVTFEDDGSAIVEFRVDGLNEITWWILSYGSQVQILAPKILQQKIIQIAQKVAKANT